MPLTREKVNSNIKLATDLGFYPYFKEINTEQGPIVKIGGKEIIMMGSNNYLGMTNHPRIKEAAKAAIDKYGVGSTGSRLLNGTMELHTQLEHRLAAFVGKPDAVAFSTGWMTNVGAIACLAEPGSWILSDEQNHASIIDGIRLSGAPENQRLIFKHCDMEDLESKLKQIPHDNLKWIMTDGVFSMEGDIAPLDEMVELAESYNARIYVDDAHSLGVLGDMGRGTANFFNVTKKVDVIMGTFSKSLASTGGFIGVNEDDGIFTRHSARSFMFSASPSPSAVATVLAVLDIIERDDSYQKQLIANSNQLREGLIAAGFTLGHSQTAIIPIIVGDVIKTGSFWKGLMDNKPRGVFSNPIISPATPEGHELIRLTTISTMTPEIIDEAIGTITKVGKKVRVIKS